VRPQTASVVGSGTNFSTYISKERELTGAFCMDTVATPETESKVTATRSSDFDENDATDDKAGIK